MEKAKSEQRIKDRYGQEYRYPISIAIADDLDLTTCKIHSKHLLPDTLNAYQLPWEWDEVSSLLNCALEHIINYLQRTLSGVTTYRETPNIFSSRGGCQKSSEMIFFVIPETFEMRHQFRLFGLRQKNLEL